jgi:transformation/transcription domain-associated protein
VKVKVEAATQLRDNLEHYITGNIYPGFLKKLMPIFIACLKGPPVFISTSAEQVGVIVQTHRQMLISYPETT